MRSSFIRTFREILYLLSLVDSMFSVFNILTRVFLFYFYRSLSENRIHSLPPGIFFNPTQLKELYVYLRFSFLSFLLHKGHFTTISSFLLHRFAKNIFTIVEKSTTVSIIHEVPPKILQRRLQHWNSRIDTDGVQDKKLRWNFRAKLYLKFTFLIVWCP